MNPCQLEGYKKLIFVDTFKRLQLTFETPRIYEIRDCNMLCRFLKTIALENKMSHEHLVDILTRWYFKMNHKKLGLLCYGFTNSGKSVLAELLKLEYREWEIGAFSCPPVTNISQFYLEALLNTFVYCCNKIVFENLHIVERMKNLSESSLLLHTDVKCKSKMVLSASGSCSSSSVSESNCRSSNGENSSTESSPLLSASWDNCSKGFSEGVRILRRVSIHASIGA